MKKIITIAAGTCLGLLLTTAMAPRAFAISAAYRAQLERTHRTQVDDANGVPAHHAVHSSAPVYTPFTKTFNGIHLQRNRAGVLLVDGKPAALDETEPTASIYKSGLMTIMAYNSGKVAILEHGQFMGYAK